MPFSPQRVSGRALERLSLVQQFNFLCIAGLIVFGVVLGNLVTHSIERNMTNRAREINAAFVQAEVHHVLNLPNDDSDFPELTTELLAQQMPHAFLGSDIVRVKVWNPSGKILWSNDASLIGKVFADDEELKDAFVGITVSKISDTSASENIHEHQFGRLMEMYVPIINRQRGKVEFVVEIYQRLDRLYEDISQQNQIVWSAIAVGFLGLYLTLLSIVKRASLTMRQQTERLLKTKEQLIQADKMVSLGILSAGVAHEINNPNQRILLNFTLFERAWEGVRPILDKYYEENGDFSVKGVNYSKLGPRMPEAFENTRKASERIKLIVKELSDFARREPDREPTRVEVNKVVRSAAFLARKMIKESTDHFHMRLQKNMPYVLGNQQRLEQVMVNLLINAGQALPERSRRLNVATGYDVENQRILIKIRDEGIGIKEEDLPRVFDPFFTTRGDVGGTGLGLAISQSIIHEHGGSIQFRSTVGQGTTATIALPVPADAIRASVAAPAETIELDAPPSQAESSDDSEARISET